MALALLLLFVTTAFAEPVDYKIASGGGNKISLELDKTGLLKGKKHNFEFPHFDGKLTYDAQAPANSRVDLKIDAASVVCKDTWLSPKDLKKVQDYALTDMLAVKQFPDIKFTSTKITPKGGDQYAVEGSLSIRGNGKPVTLLVTLKADGPVIDGKGGVKLTSYGLKPPSAALGAIGTKDEMTAIFHVAGTK